MNAPHHAAMVVPPISRRGESLGTENAFVVLAEVNALVRAGRDIGLGIVNALPGLRRRFIRQAAGLQGDLPRLLAGKPI